MLRVDTINVLAPVGGGGRGVLNLSLGRGCCPDLETLTLFMRKSL